MNSPVLLLFAITLAGCALAVHLAVTTHQAGTAAVMAAVLTIAGERLAARVGDSDRTIARRLAARKQVTA